CEAAPLSPLTIPQTPARFLNVAPHGLCPYPTALRLCYALRLEHRRCALWLGLLESRAMAKRCNANAQHDKFPLSLRA
ncbi:MAG: hypothetical protein K2N70_05390, partial [Helicobacter sp.]|nr:hypothetical protein [Helicobacter sp.]